MTDNVTVGGPLDAVALDGVPAAAGPRRGVTALTWPGAKEPGETAASPSRRRMVPPGVPDSAVWGDREPEAPVRRR